MRTSIATALALAAGLALLLTAATPDARRLARDLGAERADARDTAARELLAMGRAAAPALAEAVESGSPAARRRARALLALIDDGDERTDARRREADALVRTALRRDGEVAADSPHDRRLAEMGDAGARAIARVARRELARGAVRPSTGAAVARHPSAAAVATLASALHSDRVLGSTLVEVAHTIDPTSTAFLTEGARDELEAVLDEPQDPRRRGAAALLARFDGDAAWRLADDPDPRVRIEAASALGRHGSAAAGRSLERLALDDDTSVRRAALEALGTLAGRPRSEPAHANAEHPDAGVRAAAAALLSRDAVPESMLVLHRLSSDASLRVRAAADRSLAELRRRERTATQ